MALCWSIPLGYGGASLTHTSLILCRLSQGRFYFGTGGGDFASLRGGGATQTQKKVKLGHTSSSNLFLFIKYLHNAIAYC